MRNSRNEEKHPRVCGEDLSRIFSIALPKETPPRMRGRPVNQGLQHPAVRNTPAYAGKTKDSVLVLNQCLKHPRVCGEDPKIKAKRIHAPETPPRMRGRPQGGSCHSAPVGNTPAYAGKTLMIICLYAADWKHPRVCGEDGAALPAAVFTEETPPRMRGRL